MSESSSVGANIRVLFTTFSKYRFHVVALVVLGSLGAILEGIGINAVIPLMSFFSGGAIPGDFISKHIAALFHFLSIPFTFRFLLGFILSLFFVRAIATVAFGYIRGWISADFLSSESEVVLGASLRASWPFLLKQKIGSMHNTLVRDIQQTTGLLSVIGQVIQSFTGFVMYLLVAYNISPATTLLTLFGGAILLLLVRPLMSRAGHMGEAMTITEKSFSQFLTEHILGMKAIKASGMEERALVRGHTLMQSLRALSIRMAFVRSASSSLFQPFSLLFVVVLFSFTYKTPSFSIISFAATLYLIQKIFTYLESGQASLHGAMELAPYAQHVADFKKILAAHQEVVMEGGKPFALNMSLAFNHVSFSYDSVKPILVDVDFSIERGQTLAIVGPSGAGKTSVADLLLRLFVPERGTIEVDGGPLEDINVASWRNAIGYVPQEAFLFNGTVEENIRFYRDDLSHEDIVRAARQANIYEHIASLQEGFETVVGDRGVMLSGGQRQRIVLARALAHRPELLILDEATSALDSESENLIQEAIQNLHGSMTVCIIAHRLSTVEKADSVLVLDAGRIVERGTFRELEATPGSYISKHYRK